MKTSIIILSILVFVLATGATFQLCATATVSTNVYSDQTATTLSASLVSGEQVHVNTFLQVDSFPHVRIADWWNVTTGAGITGYVRGTEMKLGVCK